MRPIALAAVLALAACAPVDPEASVCDQWQARIASANNLVAAADLAIVTFLETSGPDATPPKQLTQALTFAKAGLAAITIAVPVACASVQP